MQGLGYEHQEGGQTSDGNIIKDMPLLTGDQLSDTGIGQLYPVSKTFLPKTKFSISTFPKNSE